VANADRYSGLYLSRVDIRYVELGPDILPSLSPKDTASLSQLLKDRGITVYSVHAPYGEKADLSSCEENKREKAISSHKEIIRKMQEFECKILVIHPGEKTEKKKAQSRLSIFYKSLEEILPLALESKITLAIENMPPGFVGSSAEELRHTIEEFSSPHLRVCFDTGHSHIGGALENDFDTLQHLIITFHIHDNDGLRDLHLQPPYGTIPWKDFVVQMKHSSFSNPIIMECFPWGRVEFEWAKKEIELLFQGKLIQSTSVPSGYVRCPSCGHFFFEEEGKPICYCSFKKHPLR